MAEEKTQQPNFSIQKLYVKDVSYESPDTPETFKFTKWDPKIELNLNNAHSKIDDNMYEAILTVTATVTHEDKVAYLIEVQQAGIFAIVGFNENDQNYLLGSQCMNILFPYAREAISDLSTRGGFPPLILAPVNFDALYQQHMQQKTTNQPDSAAQATEMEQDSEKPGAENTRH
ncbi:MAG: protein-export chaperone SecB [Gammaproteobacteria bacterium]